MVAGAVVFPWRRPRSLACLLAAGVSLWAAGAGAADRSAYVAQIGEGNRVVIRQDGGPASASVSQRGDANSLTAEQTSQGSSEVAALQWGSGNTATLRQDGQGDNRIDLRQQGDGNRALVGQSAGSDANIAWLQQDGADNRMRLRQDGDDNSATLAQDGTGNAMSAAQLGGENRLTWEQKGNNLSDLQITQHGGQTMTVIQTGL
jgi:hypothetical protein